MHREIPNYIPGGIVTGGIAIVVDGSKDVVKSVEELAYEKYPVNERDCWLMKQRKAHFRKLYIERLKNESK